MTAILCLLTCSSPTRLTDSTHRLDHQLTIPIRNKQNRPPKWTVESAHRLPACATELRRSAAQSRFVQCRARSSVIAMSGKAETELSRDAYERLRTELED